MSKRLKGKIVWKGHHRITRLKCLGIFNETMSHTVQGHQDDSSWWRVLTKHGSLGKGTANHFSILALRTPWTVWKSQCLWEGVKLLHDVAVVSAVQPRESATCMHTSPPSWTSPPYPIPPLSVITDHLVEFPVPYIGFPLAVYFTRGSVYLQS